MLTKSFFYHSFFPAFHFFFFPSSLHLSIHPLVATLPCNYPTFLLSLLFFLSLLPSIRHFIPSFHLSFLSSSLLLLIVLPNTIRIFYVASLPRQEHRTQGSVWCTKKWNHKTSIFSLEIWSLDALLCQLWSRYDLLTIVILNRRWSSVQYELTWT